ncbi:uncharacterized protein LOC105422916 isoform X1 [Pogonomyrmex barbatus]|uniref:Uncharacterized protein LOC105422916 isoform X1 n=2 Tax=Pogonomyrmex barbatus TaxID=144034 RepID=A0A6I9VPY7_9HYME|nr:uncharacterized protein LOC105422916 isoform X1 [Pogonomyrmex barbatus]XP_011630795.1 uncharacterized protein LOC105422916 isoform X1 [Pogonomyrmex barbatus]XP_011630796.1 uncharacterized protein LOC105422916 isoform X1 [Pogonomyrmex barbatus]XP_025073037.1 uncharacterized protein LOC105422916 isoform X1 [Pogonomyrmex barbatus]XP_025073038.1 uncharacterized protein LOC105422916 isoform X1 [Pogonomyrmex barbatus]
MPTNAYNYQRVPTRMSNFCWRRKWIFLFALTLSVIIVVLFTRYPFVNEKNVMIRDTYLDDVSADLYQTVLRTWYNFSNGEAWYNNKNLSTLSPEVFHDILSDIHQNWIIWNYNPKESYILQRSDIEDPSMGQSTAVREIFNDKKNGFFIECGAYDGETRSNTLFLERFNGWSGLLIEADPINFTKMLQKNRRSYLSPTCLSVTRSPTVASFLMARNVGRLHKPENTTENVSTNTLDVAYTGEHIHVQCFPLTLYIAALGIKTIDYFSLDIEGNEIDVLETIPFNEVDIKTLSVEYIHNAKGRKYLIDMMEHRGYYVYSFVEHPDNLANDIIFVKRDT